MKLNIENTLRQYVVSNIPTPGVVAVLRSIYALAFAVAQSASSLTTVGNNEQCRSHCAVPNDVTIANLP